MLKRYDTEYNSLFGAKVSILKNTIASIGANLEYAIFDKTACVDCPKNTGCKTLFLDFQNSICEDLDCYNKKYVDFAIEKLEEVRKRNPDFFIIDNYYINHPDHGAMSMLADEIRKRGFKIKVMGDYLYKPATCKTTWDNSDDNITCWEMSWKNGEFKGQRTQLNNSNNSYQPREYKDDWYLDNLAREMVNRIAEKQREVAYTRIRQKVSDKGSYMTVMTRAVLTLLVQYADDDIKFEGLVGEMETSSAADKIESMDQVAVRDAIAYFMTYLYADTETDDRFFKKDFSAEFENTYQEAYDLLIDEAKGYWHNYKSLTKEMVEKDIKDRQAKYKK